MFDKTVAVALLVAAALTTTAAEAARPKWHQLDGTYTFEQYARDFRKPYAAADAADRRANFAANLKHIIEVNADAKQTWKAGVNAFSDMSAAEFAAYNTFRRAETGGKPDRVHGAPSAADAAGLPIEVDWRAATSPRVLTAVKHQGACGSCWAHSAAESIETYYALLTGMLPVLSVGQINSCTPDSYNCHGCHGGDYVGAWNYLANTNVTRPDVLKSVTENWAYPIPLEDWFFSSQPNGTVTSACRDISKEWKAPETKFFAELTAAAVTGFAHVDSNSATGGPAAMRALRDVGPQSISVASGGWQWYEAGVYQNSGTAGTVSEWEVNHAVQLVGYGYDKEVDANYWIVRNSWSTLWGEDGFIRLWRAKAGEPEPCSAKGEGRKTQPAVCGTSGVLCDLFYPIVAEAEPTKFG